MPALRTSRCALGLKVSQFVIRLVIFSQLSQASDFNVLDVGDYVHGCSRTPHRAYPRPTGVVNIRVGSSFVFRVARQVVFCFWYNFFHIDNHRFREANSRSSSEY